MFSHLHLHTEYSLLCGMTRVRDAILRAKEFGMPALAITDYANLFGAVEFFVEAEKAGVKPIIGCEVFLPSYNDHKLKQYRKGQDFYWQLILLVQNDQGYQNLSRLITQSYLDGFYYKPRCDTSLLKEFSEGLIALSSGFHSEINHHLFNENRKAALEAVQKMAQIFPDRFYIELQDNGLNGQRGMNEELIRIGKEIGLPYVATNNVHYLNADDAEAFEALREIQLTRTIQSPQDHLLYTTNGYSFKSAAEMMADFDYCPEALKITQDIADVCQFGFTFGKYHLPKFETPLAITLEEHLEAEAKRGFEERWPKLKRSSQLNDQDKDVYLERLKLEIKMICNIGFAGYFLIVSDFIRWAKTNGVPVGPGRGSGAGSLVAYCLKITELDPLRYNLLFERFLNPERISMPDFDIDFCQDNRQRVIDYVQKKYGNVSQIITFGKMKAKAVIRDVGRVMGLEYGFVDGIAKLIPNVLNITLEDALKQEPDLKDLYDKDETVHKLIDTSLKLEGLSRHASVHAAGVIISDQPLWHFAPLYKGSNDDIVVQFDMKSAEKIGLIKFDFLGLKTLTVIKKTIDNIQKTRSLAVDIDDIPMDDHAVYDLLSRGDGCGIFQLESAGMRDLMERLQPGCFEDIVALVALFRPGPLGSGMVDDFIERKKGLRPITYELPQLKQILDETYGVIVYQEQVMQIASLLANYSLGEADILRRAMGKKKTLEMAAQRKRFMEGAQHNSVDPEKAGRLFDLMALFAEYGFNKSHSAAYALISYQTAWLKTHHVAEYMAALMSTEMNDTDKILEFINDCKQHGIELLPPDVNVSHVEFSVEGNKKIRYALGCIKGVGEAAVESILEARENKPFQSLYDFCSRVDLRRVTKKVLEVLIKSGAFDGFKISRKALLNACEKIADAAAVTQKNQEMGQHDLFAGTDAGATAPAGLEVNMKDEWSQKEMLEFEKEAFGFYFSGHPLQVYADSLSKLVTHNTAQVKELPSNTVVILGGTVLTQKTIFTKKGDKMAFVQLEDLWGSVEVIVFSQAYKKFGKLLSLDDPIIVKGTLDRVDDVTKVICETIEPLTEKLKTGTRNIRVEVPYHIFTPDKMQRVIEIVGQYKGNSVVSLHLKKENGFEAVIELPAQYKAMACEPLQHHLNRLFGDRVVKFV